MADRSLFVSVLARAGVAAGPVQRSLQGTCVMDLQQYDHMKTTLAEILRSATMRVIPDRERMTVRDLFARLAEDRFNLVVVGRFSRGKSTLMNAMLGTDRLPTGIVPVTSVITTVTYGSVEQVVLYYQHTNLFLEIPIAQLADYITERGNPGNQRRVRTAEVQLPAEPLRRGFHFIDTPGLGSSIVENTRTTEAFLPQADAFILVTSYDSPLSEEELRVLQTVQRSGRRVFLVVNKQDYVNPAQRQEVLEHLSTQLSAIFGDKPPQVFSLSAQQALEARLRGDTARLIETGLPALEAVLVGFLVNEKRYEFLLSMCSRVGAILEPQVGAEPDLKRLDELRAAVEMARPTVIPTTPALMPQSAIPPTLRGCEICRQVDDALFDFLAKYQYQLRGDHSVQADLAKRHGLCGPHTWQLERIAAPTEICTGFAGVAEQQAAVLRALARNEPNGRRAAQAIEATLPTRDICPACEVARHAATIAVDAIAQRLARDAALELRNLSAICLPHLRLLLDSLTDQTLVASVLLRHADLLHRLAEDMHHFAMKRDGVQRHLLTKEEATAAIRALRALLGEPNAHLGPTAPKATGNVMPFVRRTG
jgi:small GTP-binding protein